MSDKEAQKHLQSLSDHLGVCIKDQQRCVIFQNSRSKKLCGEIVGAVCQKTCFKLLSEVAECTPVTECINVFKKVSVEGKTVDVVMIDDGEKITTLLHEVFEEPDSDVKREAFYVSKGLTKSEIRIMKMVHQGSTNAQIAEKLFISKATLKTHLNNIYKKIPRSPARQPVGRG
ncbi:response regulator transcription factor [Bdellovibrio reynosensis]|uniref:Helix-turn-helix transcriptional regulator n=1 Tax=Bdellovibrio reynosensis TaxID=2835041 RepID=A0ABY4CDY5_9BACT|nr:helix-turn-helix transcriptional regulator [Bdellovibrio reynosensis]UOF01876.1 helix-turn-helix transcriptional regulator [Bdellovibrio reynosensis]